MNPVSTKGADPFAAWSGTWDQLHGLPHRCSFFIDSEDVAFALAPARHSAIASFTFERRDGAATLVFSPADGHGTMSWKDGALVGTDLFMGARTYLHAEFDVVPAGVRTKGGRIALDFGEGARTVKMRYAYSFVSPEQAQASLRAEIAHWDLEAVASAARAEWNAKLGKIEVEGGSLAEKRVFYTALYHTFICPNQFCDVNGDFRGMDDKVYTGNTFTNYTTLSLWDTYRQLQPMFTILAPDIVNDLVNTMLSICDQNGKLPIWPLQGGETNCMPGYSSVPVIADAYLKGFRGFDAGKALRQMVQTATNPKQRGVPQFMEHGYIPAEAFGESTSFCLEYAADDWGLALMAKAMGKQDIYDTFIRRGHAYEHYWDGAIRKCHPKMADGTWCTPYDPFLANHDHVGDFTEGNGWEYTFMVPQDPDGLVRLHGRGLHREPRLPVHRRRRPRPGRSARCVGYDRPVCPWQ